MRSVVALALAAAAAPVALGQTESRPDDPLAWTEPGWDVRRWTTDDGLPQNSVNAVAQTPDGFLWFGTFGGLSRFDGVRFATARIADGRDSATLRILSLHVDVDGGLWAGTEGQGLFRVSGNELVPIERDDGRPWGKIWSIAGDRDGILVGGAGLVRVSPEGMQTFAPIADQPDANVRDLLFDLQGTLWVVTSEGVARRAPDGAFQVVAPFGGWTIGEVEDGALLLNAGSTFLRAEGDGFVPVDELSIRNWVFAHTRDSAGRIWIGGQRGLQRLSSRVEDDGRRTLELVTLRGESELGGFVRSIFEDAEHNLWVGIDGGGVVRVKRSRALELTDLRLDGTNAVFELAGADSAEMWLSFSDRSIYRMRNGVAERAPFATEPIQSTSLGTDADGRLWIGCEGALLAWHNGVSSEHPLEGVTAQLHLQNGESWFGAAGQLVRFESGAPVEAYALSPTWGAPLAIAPAPDAGVWLITKEYLLRAARGDATAIETSHSRPEAPFRSLHVDASGTLWIGTYGGGLVRWSKDTCTVYHTSNGLLDDSLGRIFGDEHSLWINSNAGVFRVGRTELDAVASGLRDRVECVLLSMSEGNGGGGVRTADGRMWFPSIRGVVSVAPDVRLNETMPPVVIDDVKLDGRSIPFSSGIVIGAGSHRLEIAYSALSYADPERCSFRVRLRGRDTDWVEGSPDRVATYTALKAGEYDFHVVASNNDGLWNATGARLDVRVDPGMFERAWFRWLGAFVLLGLALAARHWWLGNRRLETALGQRSLAEEALRASEDTFRVVAETATDAIITINASNEIVYANPATARLFGVGPGDSIGTSLARFIPERYRARHAEKLGAYLRSGVPTIPWDGLSLSGLRADGTEFPIELSFGAHRTPDGRRAITAIMRDVTERQRLEQRLLDSRKTEALGRLAGGVAHDFNNILTALLGNVDLARESLHDPLEVERSLAQVARCGERAAALTKQLLAVSRRQIIRPIVMQPDATLAELDPLLRRLIPANIETTYALQAGSACVLADPTQFEQLVMNLALNARDAMPSGGSLRIASDAVEITSSEGGDAPPPGSYVRLSVTDTGTGIADAHLPHVFEPFFTTKPVGQGTGLGLASVHGIVQQSGAYISVDSTPGVGARFVIHLPRIDASVDAQAAPLPSPPRTDVPHRNASILVCDDYEAILEMARAALLSAGHEVHHANHPTLALELARRHSIDVLVTDVVMPGMTGPELAERVRALHPSVRVLFISGYVDEGSREGLGGATFLTKPFKTRELMETVNRVLAQDVGSVDADA